MQQVLSKELLHGGKRAEREEARRQPGHRLGSARLLCPSGPTVLPPWKSPVLMCQAQVSRTHPESEPLSTDCEVHEGGIVDLVISGVRYHTGLLADPQKCKQTGTGKEWERGEFGNM